jgi:hypothetical protein
MRFTGAFDGIICVDAMEFVFPEDWPVVMANFHRALKTKDHLYFTVEITSEEELQSAFIAGKQQGLPLVEGERAHEGGYHFFWFVSDDFSSCTTLAPLLSRSLLLYRFVSA